MRAATRRAIPLVLAGIASTALACGDRERASVPPPPPAAATSPAPPAAPARSASDSADSERARRLAASDSTCEDAIPSPLCRPFTIDGVAYTVEIEDDGETYPVGVRRVRIYDDSARLVYEEQVFDDQPADDSDERQTDVKVEGLEDASGRPRGFLLTYISQVGIRIPWIYERILAPRGRTLRTLVPKFAHPGTTGVYGESSYGSSLLLREGSHRGAVRLFEGDRLLVAEWRNRYTAHIPYRVNLDCAPATESCIRLALTDSIGGLARFPLDTLWHVSQYEGNSPVTVEVFAAPGAGQSERVTFNRRELKLLEGAGRVRFGGEGIDGTDTDLTKDDWLRVRFGTEGRTGWVRGAKTFDALGLGKIPRPAPGSPRGEM
jgi:hypothetical protein